MYSLLSKNITSSYAYAYLSDLKDHFKPCGLVLRADVLEGADGRSKGCGLVEYADSRDAARAVATLNDSELSGRRIFVREDREAPAAMAPIGRASYAQVNF